MDLDNKIVVVQVVKEDFSEVRVSFFSDKTPNRR